ncbi:MAG: ROK family protein [Actinomycetota bacterium]|nr:ROK family protein [Actinomycetota bacterium]
MDEIGRAAVESDGDGPTTLAIDVGGTGLKAVLLDGAGKMATEEVRVPTTYPCPPDRLVAALLGLTASLGAYDRLAVGFPGMVRRGRVLSAPHFVTVQGPGSAIDPVLEQRWDRFDLAAALEAEFARPTRVVNDADLQGAAVVEGRGLELVVTLGTGVGTALFLDGALAPHLEFAHHPFRHDQTYNEQLGDRARKQVGNGRWNHRVGKAMATLYRLTLFDHLYVGGGNAKHVSVDLGSRATLVDNVAGLLGGFKLWHGRLFEHA